MERNIGENIAFLRRQKGITQETLANAVGVSAAAVSKWETGASCPDVALLAPLARALRTDVNTLLGFTARPADTECAAYVNEVAALALSGDAEAVRTRIAALLREYPGCPALQYQLAAILVSLPMWAGGSECAGDRAAAKEMLAEAAEGDDPRYAAGAAHMLAGLCVGDGELARAETLLEGLPQSVPDGAMLRALIAEKRGEKEEAKRILQTELLRAFNIVETCLARLASATLAEPEEALSAIRAHEQCAAAVGFPYSMSDALYAEAYARMGDTAQAGTHLVRLAEFLSAPPEKLSSPLFAAISKDASGIRRSFCAMRRGFAESLAEEETLAPLRGTPEYETALALLRADET
ncbi:MAG: helix-turn-helix domain-containing protein [Christensenellales bacterium]